MLLMKCTASTIFPHISAHKQKTPVVTFPFPLLWHMHKRDSFSVPVIHIYCIYNLPPTNNHLLMPFSKCYFFFPMWFVFRCHETETRAKTRQKKNWNRKPCHKIITIKIIIVAKWFFFRFVFITVTRSMLVQAVWKGGYTLQIALTTIVIIIIVNIYIGYYPHLSHQLCSPLLSTTIDIDRKKKSNPCRNEYTHMIWVGAWWLWEDAAVLRAMLLRSSLPIISVVYSRCACCVQRGTVTGKVAPEAAQPSPIKWWWLCAWNVPKFCRFIRPPFVCRVGRCSRPRRGIVHLFYWRDFMCIVSSSVM